MDECIDIPNLQNIDSPIVFEEARLLSIESKVFDVFVSDRYLYSSC